MADDSQDIFGKIDAILGKRTGFAAGRTVRDEDFPLLTEVVEDAVPPAVAPPVGDAMRSGPGPSPAGLGETPAVLSEIDLDRLAAALEARLAELFIRQQLRIEDLVRRVVREELERGAGREG